MSHRSAPARLLGVVGACLVATTAFAPAARADPFADGQWYVAPFKLVQNHAVATGSGVTVAVLDTPVSPGAPSLAGADVEPQPTTLCVDGTGASPTTLDDDHANHGTAMTAMIAGQGGDHVPLGVAPRARVLTYVIGYDETPSDPDKPLDCLGTGGGTRSDSAAGPAIQDAVDKGARIISMSFGGKSSTPSIQVAIQYAARKGVVFVASTEDHPVAPGATRIDPPSSLNGVVAVNAIDRNGQQMSYSATGPTDGPLVVASAPGSELSLGGYTPAGTWDVQMQMAGSSPATAFVSGVLAATLSKWPKATGNQLIQSLARNTGGEEHGIDPRAQDGYGYGTVSLTSMLAHDPTAYPDVNPTLRDGALPSTADILGTSSSGPAPSTSASSPSQPATRPPVARAGDTATGVPTGLLVGLGIGAVVVGLVVVLLVVLLARRRRSGPPPPPPPLPSAPGGWGGT